MAIDVIAEPAPRNWAGDILALLWRERSIRIGASIVILMLSAALLAPLAAFLSGHGPTDQFPDVALDEMGLPVGPSLAFLLGADGNGRDVFIRTLYGAQVSLLVGVPATTAAMIIGTIIGTISGFFAGRVDRIVSQAIDVAMSFPFVVTALSLLSLNRGDQGLPLISPVLVVILVITLFSWTYFARLSRGLVLELRSSPMVEASLVVGASKARIIVLDILPNILPTLLVYWAVQLPANIVAEATLSFLGVGIQAPVPSWGNMIAEAQRTSLYQDQPWFLAGPGLALFLTVVGFNTLSAGLRSVLDPHQRRS
ncbi:peptide ABC transporter permease [Rhizobium sp. AC44/96]|uniref:ABC transporter permease n=1 Tax=Rhizobium sp. AC44/96 TaxID=1841654 RepID=UPI00080FDD9C|nr:ABC transporter permease [Rhizobium sp. AC44/96]OCJ09069.1 peptide ABC transporter permease [Rhizobium sp. AC44/96]